MISSQSNHSQQQPSDPNLNKQFPDSKSKKQYLCPCGKTYGSYPALYAHVKRKHDGKPPGQIVKPKSVRRRGRPFKVEPSKLHQYHPHRVASLHLEEYLQTVRRVGVGSEYPLRQFAEMNQDRQGLQNQMKYQSQIINNNEYLKRNQYENIQLSNFSGSIPNIYKGNKENEERTVGFVPDDRYLMQSQKVKRMRMEQAIRNQYRSRLYPFQNRNMDYRFVNNGMQRNQFRNNSQYLNRQNYNPLIGQYLSQRQQNFYKRPQPVNQRNRLLDDRLNFTTLQEIYSKPFQVRLREEMQVKFKPISQGIIQFLQPILREILNQQVEQKAQKGVLIEQKSLQEINVNNPININQKTINEQKGNNLNNQKQKQNKKNNNLSNQQINMGNLNKQSNNQKGLINQNQQNNQNHDNNPNEQNVNNDKNNTNQDNKDENNELDQQIKKQNKNSLSKINVLQPVSNINPNNNTQINSNQTQNNDPLNVKQTTIPQLLQNQHFRDILKWLMSPPEQHSSQRLKQNYIQFSFRCSLVQFLDYLNQFLQTVQHQQIILLLVFFCDHILSVTGSFQYEPQPLIYQMGLYYHSFINEYLPRLLQFMPQLNKFYIFKEYKKKISELFMWMSSWQSIQQYYHNKFYREKITYQVQQQNYKALIYQQKYQSYIQQANRQNVYQQPLIHNNEIVNINQPEQKQQQNPELQQYVNQQNNINQQNFIDEENEFIDHMRQQNNEIENENKGQNINKQINTLSQQKQDKTDKEIANNEVK